MLFAIRALFGIGMGGVWAGRHAADAASTGLSHLRGTASGMMQSGYSMGFLLSSLVFEFGYPLVNHTTDMRLEGDAVDWHPAGRSSCSSS